jgi:two-component system, sensor histidine kinase and response regulator
MSAALPFDDISGPGDPVAPARSRGTLLIVDDEESPRQSLRAIFKDEYNVLLAGDGPTAIALAQNNTIDVAVLDVRLVGMSGLEVLERLRDVDPKIDVVMMTAYESLDTMRQALRLGARDYITKPFDVFAMRAAVAGALPRHTLKSEIQTVEEKWQQLSGQLQTQKLEGQISQTRTEIYGSIIHDMSGPLTVIANFVQFINQRIGNLTQLGREDLEFTNDRLKTITRQVTNCIEISRRYLSFLRRQNEEATCVDVNRILADLGQFIRVHPSRRKNQFSIKSLHQNMAVRINGTDLIQILMNLVVNAFQCSANPHSVQIQASLMLEALDLRTFKDGPHDRLLNVEDFENTGPLLAVAVCDNGPGIPPELLPKIFEPYFTTKSERQGTGLGLSIVQRLIKQAKGALHVHTRAGEGTTCTVYLPALPLRPEGTKK